MLNFGPLKGLDADRIRWVVLHTTGTPNGEDTSAAAVHRYHRDTLGWSGIGYHFVIRKDGKIETGRPLTKQGAHVAGINSQSIGVAFSGNHDLHPMTPEQTASGVDLVARLCRLYEVSLPNVIGHREVNKLVTAGLVAEKYRTTKSCPGVRVQMERFRLAVANHLHPPPEPFTVKLAA